MSLKDYYSILKVPTSASLPEIKKAYRQLAQQYHPDKHDNDPYKATMFAQIKEAYETLSNPRKKKFYLQQRWFNQSMGKKFSPDDSITPDSVLKQCLELNRYVASLDVHRMNREGLAEYICEAISDSTIEQLYTFNEPGIRKTIIESLLSIIESFNHSQIEQVSLQLFKLAGKDAQNRELISKTINHLYKKEKSRKLQPLVILFITILVCLLIYFVAR